MFPFLSVPELYQCLSHSNSTGKLHQTTQLLKLKLKLRQTVSRPAYLGVKLSSGAHDQIIFCLAIAGFLMWDALSDERMGLYFTHTIASGPFHSSHFRIQFPQNSKTIFFVSSETPLTWRARFPYLYPPGTGSPGHWVPFTSPLTTRRATVEVF
jgi:hypothetical protein